ncbi:hypothetical protein LSAT2_018566 [Lamellibrachia satsuma]|nr:hypothetical protein LSAT2_018566 [Lamellibrachia satsuma]
MNGQKPYTRTQASVPATRTFGGTAKGANCLFPFTYQGANYNGCVEIYPGEMPWCKTDNGNWGYCTTVDCAVQECQNGGTLDECACKCAGAWTGGDCAVCSITECKNGGVFDLASCSCTCPTGYGGVDCGCFENPSVFFFDGLGMTCPFPPGYNHYCAHPIRGPPMRINCPVSCRTCPNPVLDDRITLLSITSKVFSRVIFDRISEALDPLLRKEQAGFRKGKSCGDHIFTLRQILEQCQEWNTPIYANFVDFEKAFDSIHRDSLWRILRHYGIPPKIVSIIKLLYGDFSTKVICGQYLTEDFEIKTGVKQGCILSPFLFCLGIDWVMKETALGDKSGIKWTFTETLGDLDYADDISLLSHRYSDIQRKSDELARNAEKIGLQIDINKTKMLRNNSETADLITIGGKDIEEVTEFTYLGAKVSTDGNSESEIKARIRKARGAFAALKNIWKTNKISNRTKIRLFKSNVLSVLLYAAESWKVTKSICQMLLEREMKALGWSWGQVTKLATDRQHWRSLVSALCVIPHEED